MKRLKKCIVWILCCSICISMFSLNPMEVNAENDFQTLLAQFPSSYQAKLRELHRKHPNWKFKRVSISLDWSHVVNKESELGVNTIASNVPKGGSSSANSAPFSYLSREKKAYKLYKDEFKLIDGKNMYTADKKVVAYYMDPRNFLTDQQIFQFEALDYNDTQTIDGVKQILNNTFMKGDYTYKDKKTKKKVKKNYAETFMAAGEKFGISPYFLAARCKNEVGAKGSGSTSGKYPGYKGYYNYFNIGAGDSSNGKAIAKGLKYAKGNGSYGRPWNNPYISIMGGSKFIANEYVALGQNTLYFQKFSVKSGAYRYWHQYSTNVQASYSQAKSVYNAYKSNGLLNKEILFYIPVYKNMPSQACSLPKREANNNNYLKSLKVSSGKKKLTLINSLNYRTKTFHMTVESDIKSIKIKGEKCSKKARIYGTGTYKLAQGKTKTIVIKCKAQNGDVRQYQIKVSRMEG